MNLKRWLATFASRPAHYTQIDQLAWLLCGWAIFYAALLLLLPRLPAVWQTGIEYVPIVAMFGNSIILLAARHQADPDHRPAYRLACLALLLTQVLNIFAILGDVEAFRSSEPPAVAGGFVLYVLVYISLIFSIGLFVPFWRFPRIPVLRITLDAALVMVLSDVLLRLLLPSLVPTWQWNGPLLATAFRLETTLGLFFWYTRLFFRFGRASVVPVRLWLLGFSCLLINDLIVLWSTFLLQSEQNLVRAAVPFWMLNQTLWALALYRNRQTPLLWVAEPPPEPAPAYPPLRHQIVRLVVTLTVLVVVVGSGPALISMVWFFCAILSRELLALFERERAVETQRAARASLAETNHELSEANAELRRIEEQLLLANERLRQLSDSQATQLQLRQIRAAEIAHDTGNLLQPARLTLALIEQELDSLAGTAADELRGHVRTMEEHVLMSENLIRTIVAAARLDAGVLRLNLSRVAVDALLVRVVRYQQSRELRPPVEIQLHVMANLPPVRGDNDLLMRSVLNLVGNAVKYTGAAREDGSGRVIVAAQVVDAHVQIVVRDNGPGIAPEVLQRLGQPFVRGVDELTAPAGFGLGLAFARGVIEQHPGATFLLSSTPGEGTTVTIFLEAVTSQPRRI